VTTPRRGDLVDDIVERVHYENITLHIGGHAKRTAEDGLRTLAIDITSGGGTRAVRDLPVRLAIHRDIRDIRAPAVKLSLLAGQICLVSWILR
jgi:hypothetical protein